MEVDKRKELVLRNTKEIIEENELEEILEEKDNPRAYVGYETSGPVHLGHWISARKMLDLQDAGFQPVILWADLHTSLNHKGEEEWIADMIEYWQATFEALGLDAEFVKGRSFQESDEYFHDLLNLSKETTLNRGKRSMAEVASGEDTYISHVLYPLMQALDIVHLDLDLALGGIEQRRIHMMARENLPKIGYEKPTCLHWPLLSSLSGEDGKMSSSDKTTMFPLHSDPERIKEVLNNAYCPAEQVEDNPIIEVCQYFIFGSDRTLEIERPDQYGGDVSYKKLEKLEEDFESGDLHPQDLKNGVSKEVAERFKPVRQTFKENPGLLKPLEELGHEKPDYID